MENTGNTCIWKYSGKPNFKAKETSMTRSYVTGKLILVSAVTSARSSDTDMTGCSTVLQGGGAACQCYVLRETRIAPINSRSAVYQLLQTEQAVQTRI